ncbi:hypothetical protein [Pontibacter kalidii]|uniref:hypothetical protein n=1 Tax=Pontibacter kalidii TaxID=2592049 RepID=UPI00225BD384|nr:hypothetical protein [Pontibacter kalidii]
MGILILPFLLGSLIAFISSAITIAKFATKKKVKLPHLFYGFVLAATLYGAVIGSYAIEKEYWTLSPLFRFPIFMFLIPFGIAVVTKNSQSNSVRTTAIFILISILFSGAYFIAFNNLTIELLDRLGTHGYY